MIYKLPRGDIKMSPQGQNLLAANYYYICSQGIKVIHSPVCHPPLLHCYNFTRPSCHLVKEPVLFIFEQPLKLNL